MDKNQKEELLIKELTKMFVVTGDEATPDKILAYVEYLRDYAIENNHSFEEVLRSIKSAGLEIQYTPKLSDIIKFLGPSKEEDDAELLNIAQYESQQTLNDLRTSSHPRTSDLISLTVINQIGFHQWKGKPESETLAKFPGLFISTYKTLAKAERSGNNIALQEAQEKKERAALYE